MNTLVLQAYTRRLDHAFFTDGWLQPVDVASHLVSAGDAVRTAEALREALASCRRHGAGKGVELIAVRAAFGGSEFDAPALVTPRTLRKLRDLIPQDPFHMPALLELLDCCGEVFPAAPIVLVFETAFFASLPPREHLYGLDAQLTRGMNLRRYGYNGIYHEAAALGGSEPAVPRSYVCGGPCEQERQRHGPTSSEDRASAKDTRSFSRTRRTVAPQSAPPAAPQAGLQRILSICLESRPEIAAILGRQAVMVTSGATPLEGLPGQTSCGELDPGIVLMLAQKLGWGAEQINLALTRESGWQALADVPPTERVDLATLLTSTRPQFAAARDMLRYRMLLACGAGVAAMGGVDRLVFSGRYAALAGVLGPWLKEKLDRACRHAGRPIEWTEFAEPLDRLIADAAMSAGRERVHAPAGDRRVELHELHEKE